MRDSLPDVPTVYSKIPRMPIHVIERAIECPVAAIADALGPNLAEQQLMQPIMRRQTTRKRIAGQAITATGSLGDNSSTHQALLVADKGDVIVIASGRSQGAQWGGLVSQAAKARGITGAVVDGAVRDLDDTETTAFPVWGTVVSPLGGRKTIPGFVNVPIACAGVRVDPGDLVVADGDGVLVIPFSVANEVVEKAMTHNGRERTTKEAATDGRLPGEAGGLYAYLESQGMKRVDGQWSSS